MASHLLPCCLTIGLLLAPLLQAQESQWQELAQIKARTNIQVVERSLKNTSGRLMRVSETDLTLRVENNELVVPKDRVFRVSISGKNRKRNVLIGLAAGSAVGAGLGAAANQVVGDARVIPGMALSFGAFGAGIGALVPAAKSVYRAELPRQASLKEQSRQE
jgi:hypothetical protein